MSNKLTTTQSNKQMRQIAFLRAFVATAIIGDACKESGVSPTTVNYWRKTDSRFAELFEDARLYARADLEREARRRAVDGIDRPVGMYKGVPTAIVREYSDRMLIYLLDHSDGEFNGSKRKVEISGPNSGPIEVSGSGTLPIHLLSAQTKLAILKDLANIQDPSISAGLASLIGSLPKELLQRLQEPNNVIDITPLLERSNIVIESDSAKSVDSGLVVVEREPEIATDGVSSDEPELSSLPELSEILSDTTKDIDEDIQARLEQFIGKLKRRKQDVRLLSPTAQKAFFGDDDISDSTDDDPDDDPSNTN